MEILKVEHLSKVYGKGENKVVALDDVSFTVNKGEFVAIVGASGSGKSTLLYLIGGVDRPTKGKVFIGDKDIYSLNDDKLAIFRRRQVGLIYQFYNLIPILNGEENITLPLELDNRKVDKTKLKELLKQLGLESRKHHLPNELSGGQQQRTSIGRAIITNPSVILADEPTGNLDTKSSDEIDKTSSTPNNVIMGYSFYGRLSVADLDENTFKDFDLPPTYYVYGTEDPFYNQFNAQVDLLENLNKNIEVNVLDNYPHGFGASGNWISKVDAWIDENR